MYFDLAANTHKLGNKEGGAASRTFWGGVLCNGPGQKASLPNRFVLPGQCASAVPPELKSFRKSVSCADDRRIGSPPTEFVKFGHRVHENTRESGLKIGLRTAGTLLSGPHYMPAMRRKGEWAIY